MKINKLTDLYNIRAKDLNLPVWIQLGDKKTRTYDNYHLIINPGKTFKYQAYVSPICGSDIIDTNSLQELLEEVAKICKKEGILENKSESLNLDLAVDLGLEEGEEGFSVIDKIEELNDGGRRNKTGKKSDYIKIMYSQENFKFLVNTDFIYDSLTIKIPPFEFPSSGTGHTDLIDYLIEKHTEKYNKKIDVSSLEYEMKTKFLLSFVSSSSKNDTVENYIAQGDVIINKELSSITKKLIEKEDLYFYKEEMNLGDSLTFARKISDEKIKGILDFVNFVDSKEDAAKVIDKVKKISGIDVGEEMSKKDMSRLREWLVEITSTVKKILVEAHSFKSISEDVRVMLEKGVILSYIFKKYKVLPKEESKLLEISKIVKERNQFESVMVYYVHEKIS